MARQLKIAMLKFLRRSDVPAIPRAAPGSPRIHMVPEAIPTPEVVEGNGESDWALWEDSVAFQESRTCVLRSEPEIKLADPFKSVHKHAG
jgi:hypothetical protein